MNNTLPNLTALLASATPGPWRKTANFTVSCPQQPSGKFLVAIAFSEEDAQLLALASHLPQLAKALQGCLKRMESEANGHFGPTFITEITEARAALAALEEECKT